MDAQTKAFVRQWVRYGVGQTLSLSAPVRRFLEDTLIEGFDERRTEEWPQLELKLSPNRAVTLAQAEQALVGTHLESAIHGLIEDAALMAQLRDSDKVLMIDVLEAINKR